MKAERIDSDDELLIDVFFTNLVKGQDGETPTVGSNLNWWIAGEDTGIRAKADIPEIGANGNWWIGGTDTGKPALAEIPDTVKIPKGAILLWSGSPAAIPSGWALCNGNNNTPDLRGRFVVGYDPGNADYNNIGKTAGSKTVKLTSAHLPEHAHLNGTATVNYGDKIAQVYERTSQGIAGSIANCVVDIGMHEPNVQGRTSKAGYDEGHITPVDIRPPYYVLAYIMKL